MKNIFKFLGIALMACSLTLVACNKDDDKKASNDSTPVNPDPVNPDPVDPEDPASYTIAINGTACSFNYTEAITNESVFLFFGAAQLNGNDAVPPMAAIYFGREGNSVALAEELDLDYSSYYVDAAENTWFYFMNYQDLDPIYAFDATKLTITCEAYMFYYKYEGYLAALESVLAIDELTMDDWGSLSAEEKSAYANAALEIMLQNQEDNFMLMSILFTNYPFELVEE